MDLGLVLPSMTTKIIYALILFSPSESVLAKYDEILGLYFSKSRIFYENTFNF
jgi:hypothetical protein